MRRIVNFVLAFLAFFLGVVAAAADIPPRMSVNRSIAPVGQEVFSLESTRIWGGVVLQAKAEVRDAAGAEVKVSELSIGEYDPRKDLLCITHKGVCYELNVNEDMLSRLVFFVHNKGTGVYTANPVTDKDVREAGLKPGRTGYIAAEFEASAEINAIGEHLDFVSSGSLRTPPNEKALIEKWNAGLNTSGDGRREDANWIVTDVDAKFVARLSAGRLAVVGTPSKYSRALIEGTHRAVIFRISELRPDITEEDVTITDLLLAESRDPKEVVKTYRAAIHFARTCAFLRTLHAGNQKAWDQLVTLSTSLLPREQP